MRLLHTSDWHLGASENERSLRPDQDFFIDAICNIIEQEKVDAVLLAGDVYDRSVASADAIRMYDAVMTRICMDLRVKVLSIAGNHDSAERLSSCGALLEKAGLYVAGAITTEPCMVEMGDVDVYLLPWFTEEKVRSLYPEKKDEIRTMSDAYQVVCDGLRASFRPGRKHLVVSHAFIVNAETSTSDRAAEIGFATAVNSSVFDGFDYVALGHIHKPQDITDRIRYSGTPMPYSFGKEESQVKSVTIIDTDTMEKKIIPLPLLHKRTTISGTLDEVMNFPCDADVRNGFVRIQVTDVYVGLETLSQLKAIYPNALEISGKQFEDGQASIRMSMDEFRQLETNPLEIFRHFYMDTASEEECEEPDEHLKELFCKAMEKYEEGRN